MKKDDPIEIRISSDFGANEKLSLSETLDSLKKDIEIHKSIVRIQAALIWEKYDGLVKCGFSKEEALFLVK